jgi:hypothetical protein
VYESKRLGIQGHYFDGRSSIVDFKRLLIILQTKKGPEENNNA